MFVRFRSSKVEMAVGFQTLVLSVWCVCKVHVTYVAFVLLAFDTF